MPASVTMIRPSRGLTRAQMARRPRREWQDRQSPAKVTTHHGDHHIAGSTLTVEAVAVRPMEPLIEPLTARELEVLGLLANAASNREIADLLVISPRTVESHLANIYGKLGVRGRPEAILWAVRQSAISSS